MLYKAVFGLLSRMRRLLRVAPSFLGYGALGAQEGGELENNGTSVPSEIKFCVFGSDGGV